MKINKTLCTLLLAGQLLYTGCSDNNKYPETNKPSEITYSGIPAKKANTHHKKISLYTVGILPEKITVTDENDDGKFDEQEIKNVMYPKLKNYLNPKSLDSLYTADSLHYAPKYEN